MTRPPRQPLPGDQQAAAAQYAKAAELSRLNLRHLTAARIPLGPGPDGRPPPWTAEQREAVWAAAWSLALLQGAREHWDTLVDPGNVSPPPGQTPATPTG